MCKPATQAVAKNRSSMIILLLFIVSCKSGRKTLAESRFKGALDSNLISCKSKFFSLAAPLQRAPAVSGSWLAPGLSGSVIWLAEKKAKPGKDLLTDWHGKRKSGLLGWIWLVFPPQENAKKKKKKHAHCLCVCLSICASVCFENPSRVLMIVFELFASVFWKPPGSLGSPAELL